MMTDMLTKNLPGLLAAPTPTPERPAHLQRLAWQALQMAADAIGEEKERWLLIARCRAELAEAWTEIARQEYRARLDLVGAD